MKKQLLTIALLTLASTHAGNTIGGDSNTWSPKSHNLGGDPRTWGPNNQPQRMSLQMMVPEGGTKNLRSLNLQNAAIVEGGQYADLLNDNGYYELKVKNGTAGNKVVIKHAGSGYGAQNTNTITFTIVSNNQ